MQCRCLWLHIRLPFLRSQFESGTLLNYFLIILKDTPVVPYKSRTWGSYRRQPLRQSCTRQWNVRILIYRGFPEASEKIRLGCLYLYMVVFVQWPMTPDCGPGSESSRWFESNIPPKLKKKIFDINFLERYPSW